MQVGDITVTIFEDEANAGSAMPNVRLMPLLVHEPTETAMGGFRDLVDAANYLENLSERLRSECTLLYVQEEITYGITYTPATSTSDEFWTHTYSETVPMVMGAGYDGEGFFEITSDNEVLRPDDI